jgi:tetratricopeptide (TPR) repeat protein
LTAEALDAYRESLALENSWRGRWERATVLAQTAWRAEAEAEFQRLAASAPTKVDARVAWLTLGDLQWAAGASEKALGSFKSALAVADNTPARLRAAEAAHKLGHLDEEARLLEPLASASASDGVVKAGLSSIWQERLCRALLATQQRDAAERCLQQLAVGAEREPRSWSAAADIAKDLGRSDERVRYLLNALNTWREAPDRERGLSAAYGLLALGHPAEAGDLFGKLWNNTGDPHALLGQGEALLAAHKAKAAADVLERVAETPGAEQALQARATAALGYARRAAGDRDGAAEAWLRALALIPAEGQFPVHAGSDRTPAPADLPDNELALVMHAGVDAEKPIDRRAFRDSLVIQLALAEHRGKAALTVAEPLAEGDPTADHLALLAAARAATGDKVGAAVASARAADLAPADAERQAQAGYAELAAGDAPAAARRFEAALARDPNLLNVSQDVPRAYVRSGAWSEARRAFERAIMETAAHKPAAPKNVVLASNGPLPAKTYPLGDANAQNQVLHDLRRENAAATREISFEFVDTICSPGSAEGCGLTSPSIQRLGSAGIGAASVFWTPHLPGDPDPQHLALYTRVLWANEPGGLSPHGPAFQGGVGVRFHPFANVPLFLWAERMIALGHDSQDNWLLRATAGWDTGAVWRAGEAVDWIHDWKPYFSVYGDVGRLLLHDHDWLAVGEVRLGGSLQPYEDLMVTPYVFVRDELDAAGSGTSNSLQIGAGVSFRMRFWHDPLLGYRLEPETFIRIAHDVSRNGGPVGTRLLGGIALRL